MFQALPLRSIAFRGLAEDKFRCLQNVLKRVWNIKKPIINEVIPRPIPKPVEPKTFLAVFRCNVNKAFTNPAVVNKSAVLNNAKLLTNKNVTYYNIPSYALPSLKSIISRLFQIGFVGVVFHHQQLSRDGQGFVKTMDDLKHMIEGFKKEEGLKNGDVESEFEVVGNDSQMPSDGTMSSENHDIQSLVELNTNLQEKLIQLEPLIHNLVDEKIEQERRLAETQEREKFYREKCEQLEKDNKEILRRQDMILDKVEKMMDQVAENNARMAAESSRRCLSRVDDDSLAGFLMI